jgi:hypothetical protein
MSVSRQQAETSWRAAPDSARAADAPRKRVATLVLVALAAAHSHAPVELLDELRRCGAVVYVTHGVGGCLRAATAARPSMIYLDPHVPRRLLRLLQAHPVSAPARIRWLPTQPKQSVR